MDELLVRAVSELNEDKVLRLVKNKLANNADPKDILSDLQLGMDRVGELYEKSEYFIADLIMAGIIFKEIIEFEDMKIIKDNCDNNSYRGRILLGTVRGDLHDIGKDIFKGLAESSGFEVIDLGIDVSQEVFCEKIIELKPNILGLSGVLTIAINSMEKTVKEIQYNSLRKDLKIIVGGGMLNEDLLKKIGADAYSNNAATGVKKCIEWVTNPFNDKEK
ncbi:MAG: cobalamin B12-binding domain-containing protein [Eubacteriaceae bacterium]